MKPIYDHIVSEYDTKLKAYVEERRYMDAYKYIFKQKNLVSDLDRSIYLYLILWQVKVEIYLGIIEDAKEHFLNIFDNIILSKNNIPLFIECVLLLDMFELSLKKDGIYEQLINYDEENNWINLYIFILSFKNKSRNYSIEDELLYMAEKNTDRFFRSLIHTVLAEAYKDDDDARWRIELRKAYELNHDNLRMIRLMIQWGVKGDDELRKVKYFRYFPENKFILKKYYQLYSEVDGKGRDFNLFKFNLLEGGGTGGSSYLITYDGVNVLLDCGINFKDDNVYYDNLKKIGVDIKDIDLLVITHCHLDHCGGIVNLVKSGLSCPVIMSYETKYILNGFFSKNSNMQDLNLNDADYKLLNKINSMTLTDCLFDESVKGRKVLVKLMPSGHILGACGAYVEIDGFSVFYTGDFTVKDVETNSGLTIPDGMHADVLITEATFGYTSSFSVYDKAIQDKLILEVIRELANHGVGFIPAFAVGKAQDLLILMKKNFEYMPYNVYVDGALSYITMLYEKLMGPIYGNGVLNANDIKLYDSKREFIRKEISLGNCLVMTSSDNLTEGSTSFVYGRELMSFDNAILLNISNNIKKPISMLQENIPIINHGILQDILEVFLKLTPKKVYIVHRGAKTNSTFNIEEILNLFDDVDVVAP